VGKFPTIVSYSIEGEIRPAIELLLELGIPQSDIHKIMLKSPQLFGLDLNDKLEANDNLS
jgi:mTERF domain-containing protein